MPCGMQNAPATFQRPINHVTAEVNGYEAYIDDIIIYSEYWSDHVELTSVSFGKLKEVYLIINLAKSESSCALVSFWATLWDKEK